MEVRRCPNAKLKENVPTPEQDYIRIPHLCRKIAMCKTSNVLSFGLTLIPVKQPMNDADFDYYPSLEFGLLPRFVHTALPSARGGMTNFTFRAF